MQSSGSKQMLIVHSMIISLSAPMKLNPRNEKSAVSSFNPLLSDPVKEFLLSSLNDNRNSC
jgi:hypothetical protein